MISRRSFHNNRRLVFRCVSPMKLACGLARRRSLGRSLWQDVDQPVRIINNALSIAHGLSRDVVKRLKGWQEEKTDPAQLRNQRKLPEVGFGTVCVGSLPLACQPTMGPLAVSWSASPRSRSRVPVLLIPKRWTGSHVAAPPSVTPSSGNSKPTRRYDYDWTTSGG